MIKPYKNRGVNYGQKVLVYKNLHNGLYSIMCPKSRRVLAHGTDFNLVDCHFRVSEAGRQRVIKEKRKNVHAFVIGIYTDGVRERVKIPVSYNPYESNKFYCIADNGRMDINFADHLTFTNKGVFY